MSQQLIFTNEVRAALLRTIGSLEPASVHVLTDANVARCVLPQLGLPASWPVTVIEPGDSAKTIATATEVWRALASQGATRRSVMVNAGGGMVTDLGGFAAATFKRGIRFVNVPTTLLSAVDASVGGKTGVNLDSLKNEVGVFAEAEAVIVSSCFFATLPEAEILSGYGEMLKHALLTGSGDIARLLRVDPLALGADEMLALVEESVRVKEKVVISDPTERGLRRVLNLGHTAGHAFESMAMRRGSPLPHGHAVVAGMAVELILSHLQLGFPSATLHTYLKGFASLGYRRPAFTCSDYPELLELMTHDKKNAVPTDISFTLLKAPGEPVPGCIAKTEEIKAALDIYQDLG